jgi:O-antigen/teichoic acid export membrane protein
VTTASGASQVSTGLGRATLWVSVSNLGARGIGLVVALAAAYVVGPVELGVFAIMTVLSGLLAALGVLGFAPLCTRAVATAQEPAQARSVLNFVLTRSLLLQGVVLAGYAGLLGLSVSSVRVPGVGGLATYLVIPLWACLIGLNSVVVSAVTGHRAFRTLALINVTRSVLVGVLTMTACIVSTTAESAAAGAAFGELAALCFGLICLRRSGWLGRAGPSSQSAELRIMLKQAVLAGLASVALVGAMWWGQVLVSRSDDGLVGSGAFLLCSRLLLVVTLVPNALSAAALPMLSRQGRASLGRRNLEQRSLRLGLSAAVMTAVVLVAGIATLLPILSPEYSAFKVMFGVMGLVGIAVAANNILGSILLGAGQTRTWIASDWVLAVTLFLVALVAVRTHGATGLAMAHLAGYGASVLVMVAFRHKGMEEGDRCAS